MINHEILGDWCKKKDKVDNLSLSPPLSPSHIYNDDKIKKQM